MASEKDFIPHLEDMGGQFYGMLGGFTRIRDMRGKLLRVGDTVRASHNSGNTLQETPVIFPNDDSDTGSYPSIYGISNTCSPDGSVFGGWMITRIRGFDEVEDGESVNPHPAGDPRYAITYVKSPD